MNLIKNYVTTLMKKVSKTSCFVKPERLPPTERGVVFHCFRTYLQVQKWCYPEQSLDPEDWGWKKVENEFVPITTDLLAAPKDITNYSLRL